MKWLVLYWLNILLTMKWNDVQCVYWRTVQQWHWRPEWPLLWPDLLVVVTCSTWLTINVCVYSVKYSMCVTEVVAMSVSQWSQALLWHFILVTIDDEQEEYHCIVIDLVDLMEVVTQVWPVTVWQWEGPICCSVTQLPVWWQWRPGPVVEELLIVIVTCMWLGIAGICGRLMHWALWPITKW